MTAVAAAPPASSPTDGSAVAARRRRAARRGRWRDTLEATAWLVGAGSIALTLASGTADVTTPAGLLTTLGRLAGSAASIVVMVQLLLIARVPVIERVVGHDRGAIAHARLGRLGFLVIIAHIVLVAAGYAYGAQPFLAQTWEFATGYGTPMLLACLGFMVLVAVVVTSYAIVRSRWRYENWHAVHVFSYLAVGLSIPHQLTDGSTYRTMGLAWWFWVVLWGAAVGGLLHYRVLVPLARLARDRIVVAGVDRLADGSTAVTLTGRRLDRLGARPGQFVLVRFLAAGQWGQAHPYSLSRAPRDRWLRITVKPLGDGSAAVATVRPGTRVMLEGPLGVFTDAARSGDHLVLAGAGIGVAPILALLEGAPYAPGRCTVIVRGSTPDHIPHLDEILWIARERGAAVHVLTGPRGEGWTPDGSDLRLVDAVPGIAGADVFVCGPEPWVEAMLAEADASGVPAERRHAEAFAW